MGRGEFENLWEFRPMVGVKKALGSLDSRAYFCAQHFGTLNQKLGGLNPPGEDGSGYSYGDGRRGAEQDQLVYNKG